LSACQTGNTGDGLLWSVEAQQVQRIRDQQTLA
jgi:nitrogen regulatory protein PII